MAGANRGGPVPGRIDNGSPRVAPRGTITRGGFPSSPVASRMKQIAANLKATVVIQHDMRDIGKLPAFPAAAK